MGAFKIEGNVFSHIKQSIIKVGDKLEFRATNLDMTEFKIINLNTKYKVISVVPSIDTSVCYKQTVEFNKKMAEYDNVSLITISRDLPFAQERACESFKTDEHILLSDYNYRDFGIKSGLFFTESQILPRAVLILDSNNIVQYLEVVNPVGNEPNYQAVYNFLDQKK